MPDALTHDRLEHFRRVLPYIRPYRRLAVVSVALIVVSAMASLLTPWPLLILVDHVLPDAPLPGVLETLFGSFGQRTQLMLAVFAAFGITVLVNGLAVVDQGVNTRIDQGMALDFRSNLFDHAQKLSMAFYDQRRTGHLIFAINSQGEAVSRLIMTVPPIAQSVLTLIGMAWISWQIDRTLTAIALSIAPLLYFSTSYYMKHIHSRLVEVRNMEGEALSIIHESITMMRVIVAFCRERFERDRYHVLGSRAAQARVDVTIRQAVFSLVVASIIGIGSALVLGIGFMKAIDGEITVGQLLVVFTYVSMVYQPLSTISTTIGSLQEVFVNLQIAFDLLDTEPDVKELPDAAPLARVTGKIRFENVDFSYVGREHTLQSVSLEASPGQVVAIVGHTGAGKTTLISLLPRFYDPHAGRILIDNVDTRTTTLLSLREQISIVLQEPLLFSGTIASNIRYGKPDAPLADVVAAARAANAHDFIDALPDGYDTVLGERGAKLSGGERQRISVARAFLKDAPILILDEPTSSIDAQTEEVILDALDKLIVGRTTFIIAHRLSTIRRADTILVMDHGRIVEHGPESELLARDGAYRRLYELQMGGNDDDAAKNGARDDED